MAAITSAVVGVASAGYQIASAEKAKADAKKGIKKFKPQDLVNPATETSISTTREDKQLENNLINTATSVEALRRAGTRATLSGIPRINENNILLDNLVLASLDEKEAQRQIRIEEGEKEIRDIRERREELALQGFGQQLQTARQDTASGLFNLASAGLSFGSAIGSGDSGGTDDGGTDDGGTD